MNMSVNSSTTSNNLLVDNCSIISFYINFVLCVLKVILIFPLSVMVLYLGHQRWRQQSSFKTESHSNVFSHHMAAMELIWVFGFFCYFYGTYSNDSVMVTIGLHMSSINFYGEICFHVLTCVERYMAVVHPITYLHLRNARGVRIRNISSGCVWLLSFGLTIVTALYKTNNQIIFLLCILVLCITIISFCSLSVVCVLLNSGPGEGSKEKERVVQSKRRAFYTITAICCAVWLWFFGLLVSVALMSSPLLSITVKCIMLTCAFWFNIPSSLVLPLLYLHRARKLSCCLYNNE